MCGKNIKITMPTAHLKIYRNGALIGDEPITEKQILDAIEQYDREYPLNDYPRTDEVPKAKTWFENQNYDYALRYRGKCYPVKYILRVAISPSDPDEVAGFYGGWESGKANHVLEALGFDVIPKSECN